MRWIKSSLFEGVENKLAKFEKSLGKITSPIMHVGVDQKLPEETTGGSLKRVCRGN